MVQAGTLPGISSCRRHSTGWCCHCSNCFVGPVCRLADLQDRHASVGEKVVGVNNFSCYCFILFVGMPGWLYRRPRQVPSLEWARFGSDSKVHATRLRTRRPKRPARRGATVRHFTFFDTPSSRIAGRPPENSAAHSLF